MRLVFSREAKADLAKIGDWIAQHNPIRAVTFVDELEQRCVQLTTMPRAYPLVPRHEESGIRRRVYRGYLIFYRIRADPVEIAHVLNGAQDYEPILFPDEE